MAAGVGEDPRNAPPAGAPGPRGLWALFPEPTGVLASGWSHAAEGVLSLGFLGLRFRAGRSCRHRR